MQLFYGATSLPAGTVKWSDEKDLNPCFELDHILDTELPSESQFIGKTTFPRPFVQYVQYRRS